jgi:hypothetical protein
MTEERIKKIQYHFGEWFKQLPLKGQRTTYIRLKENGERCGKETIKRQKYKAKLDYINEYHPEVLI